MKKLLLIIGVLGIIISCSDDNDSNVIEIDGTEHIWFNDNSSANIMYGGVDYGIKFNYKQKGDIIEFITEDQPFSFRIESESVLIRIEDNEVWTKTE